MKTAIDLNALVIDGNKLKQAREAKGMTVAETALLVTLSREQIVHIEEGGERPFYTPAHKLLAIRKYATAMDIPYDEVVTGPGAEQTMPIPEDAPPAMMSHSEGEEAADLRLAAVERNAEIRRKLLMGAIAITVLLAIYAKMRGSQDELYSAVNPPEVQVMAEEPAAPATEASAGKESSLPATAASTVSPAALAAPAPVSAPVTAQPSAPVPASATAAATDSVTKPAADKMTAEAGDECQFKAGSEIRTWSPPYQRKSDVRLFVISPKGGSLCIADASGKSKLITLKPMNGQSFSGKPPYTVRSSQLATIEIYLQGLRVKVPAEAESLRLVPTQVTSPPSDSGNSSGA